MPPSTGEDKLFAQRLISPGILLESRAKTVRTAPKWNCSQLWSGYIAVVLLWSHLIPAVSARDLPDIYWNSTNPIFSLDNTQHIFGVRMRDRVNIVCPYYDPKALVDSSAKPEYSEIYSVSRWGYENCQLSDYKIVGVCVQPTKPSSITVVFREFTPKPGGLEFKPGQNYYFIATSSGPLDGLQNKRGGLCLTENMRLIFEVAPGHGQMTNEYEGGQPSRYDPSRNGVATGDGDASRLADNSLARESTSSQDAKLSADGNVSPVFNSPSVVSYTKQPNVDQSTDHTEHASFIISDEYIPGSNKQERRTSGVSPVANPIHLLTMILTALLVQRHRQ